MLFSPMHFTTELKWRQKHSNHQFNKYVVAIKYKTIKLCNPEAPVGASGLELWLLIRMSYLKQEVRIRSKNLPIPGLFTRSPLLFTSVTAHA